MKTILLIKTHSVIDVITNSSSELFACSVTSLDTVNEILKNKKIKGIEDPWVFNLREYRNWRTLQQYATQKDWDHHFAVIEGWFFDPESEEDMRELREYQIESYGSPWHERVRLASGTAKGWEQREAEIKKIYQELEYADVKPAWWNDPNNDHRGSVIDLDGCVIIESTGDNSIDWEDMEWIEETFNASRIHLG